MQYPRMEMGAIDGMPPFTGIICCEVKRICLREPSARWGLQTATAYPEKILSRFELHQYGDGLHGQCKPGQLTDGIRLLGCSDVVKPTVFISSSSTARRSRPTNARATISSNWHGGENGRLTATANATVARGGGSVPFDLPRRCHRQTCNP